MTCEYTEYRSIIKFTTCVITYKKTNTCLMNLLLLVIQFLFQVPLYQVQWLYFCQVLFQQLYEYRQ